jgi:hypothetical protein
MSNLLTAYALFWAILLVVAPITCAYGLIRASRPLPGWRGSGIALLGFLLSLLLIFALVTTTLLPLSVLFLFAPLIFGYAIFKPSTLIQKGVRVYLIFCMTASEMLSIWMCWATVMRSRS